MMVRTLQFEEVVRSKSVFGSEIESDPWVAFHGTSSIYEQEVDTHGFGNGKLEFTGDELDSIISIFDWMNWATSAQGNLSVYSRNRVQTGRVFTTYFREEIHRAMGFCSRELAGGETVRIVFQACKDLRRYLRSQRVRAEHMYELKANKNALVPVELPELSRRIAQIEPLEQRARRLVTRYRHGVLYAVRFEASDVDHMTYCIGGIACSMGLPASRIVAKARLKHVFPHYDTWMTGRGDDDLRPGTLVHSILAKQ